MELISTTGEPPSDQQRQRIRELGINTGILTPDTLNAITDVKGVKVGHPEFTFYGRNNTTE